MEVEEQYEKVCAPHFEEIRLAIGRFDSCLTDVKERLFIDNGRKSLQSRVNDNARWVKWLIGIFSALFLLLMGGLAAQLF